MKALQVFAQEGARYFIASSVGLAIDLVIYSGLIRLMDVHYLVAAPIAMLIGLTAVYLLSVRWVFRHRRLQDARAEFVIFAALGLAGLAINQAMVYAGVEWLKLDYEPAKLLSAGVSFCFNFVTRKLLLFTRY
jgi:putative flippase GtrA